MKKSSILVFVLSIISITANASHAQYWAKTYGGFSTDIAKSIQQISDGGFIIAGYTISFGAGADDAWVLKIDSNGDCIWQKTYGGSGYDKAYCIQETFDEYENSTGYIFAGSTKSFGAGTSDFWVLKLDRSGNVTWQKTYGGNDEDEAYFIQQTSDRGYIIGGSSASYAYLHKDVLVLKINGDGEVIWQKTYGDSIYHNHLKAIQQTPDGGYVILIASELAMVRIYETLVLKLDSNGNVSWYRNYTSQDCYPYSMQETSDGGYIIAGDIFSPDYSSYKAWVLKLDSNGFATWQKVYEGYDFDSFHSIQQTSDGGYIAGGDTSSSGAGENENWIVKLNATGDISWQKIYAGGSVLKEASIQQTSDGGYIVADGTSSLADFYVLKLDSSGLIPYCDIIGTSNLVVSDGEAIDFGINLTVQSITVTTTNTSVTPQDSSADVSTICCYEIDDYDCDDIVNDEDNCSYISNPNQEDVDEDVVGDICDNCLNNYNPAQMDSDEDNLGDACDNCPNDPNGPLQGTCTEDFWGDQIVSTGQFCTVDADCDPGEFCEKTQADTYPPGGGNGMGDACDCECDFDCSGGVDATDVTVFLTDFGRSIFVNPCTNADPCNGDVDCNVNVDASDVTKLLEDFGRSQYNKPCPQCVAGDWCVYP
jgi:hypothetical protein